MPELQKHRNLKTVQPNITILTGSITIGASGAVTAQTDTRNGGITFTKNATAGRYDAVIHRAYRRGMRGTANIMGATAGTVPSGAKLAYVTGISAANVAGTAGFSTFSIQCTAADGATATNPGSGDIVTWELQVSDSP